MQSGKPSGQQIVLAPVDILKTVCGQQTAENLLKNAFVAQDQGKRFSLVDWLVNQPNMEALIEKFRQSYSQACDQHIKTYLSLADQRCVPMTEQIEFVVLALTAGKYVFQEKNDPVLVALSQRPLLNHYSLFRAVIGKLTAANFSACLEQIRVARSNSEFTPLELSCIQQRKDAFAELEFKRWVAGQYELAARAEANTVEMSSSMDEQTTKTQQTMHRMFDDSPAKKRDALNRNQPSQQHNHAQRLTYGKR